MIPYPFPLSITPEQFEFIEDWVPANDATRNLIRNAGWREITSASVVKREYMGIVTLGNIDASNTAYFAFANDAAKTDFDLTDQLTKQFKPLVNAATATTTNADKS